MRCGFLFGGLFWGSVLFLAGASIIVKTVFKINIPFFRIGVALFLIYSGISILSATFSRDRVSRQWPCGSSSASTVLPSAAKLDVVFSHGIIDLTETSLEGKGLKKEINVIFSSAEILISRDIPARVTVGGAFSATVLPDGSSISFGDYEYKTSAFTEGQPFLDLKLNVVFGNAKVIGR